MSGRASWVRWAIPALVVAVAALMVHAANSGAREAWFNFEHHSRMRRVEGEQHKEARKELSDRLAAAEQRTLARAEPSDDASQDVAPDASAAVAAAGSVDGVRP